MFSTGYILQADTARNLAEPSDGPTIEWAAKLASACNLAIAGRLSRSTTTVGCSTGHSLPSHPAKPPYYDKHHLFSTGGEDKVYTSGHKAIPTIRFRGWNIALAVCYDLRFPIWLRNSHNGYDLLIIVANWPDSRAYMHGNTC